MTKGDSFETGKQSSLDSIRMKRGKTCEGVVDVVEEVLPLSVSLSFVRCRLFVVAGWPQFFSQT